MVEITYCEKHNLPSYHHHGWISHTCTVCYPELIEKVEKPHKRISNFGALLVNGELCDEHTLSFLKKNAKISATVPDHASINFFNDCVDCGHDVDYGKNDVIFVSHSKAKNYHEKQWYSTLITFPYNETVKHNLEKCGFNVRSKGNQLTVSNNEFTGYVLSNL